MIIIGAGAGCFLTKVIADDERCHFMSAYQTIPACSAGHFDATTQQAIDLCFPAYAVAYLRVKSVFSLKKPC
jgi:hypothetical protein